MLRGNDGLETLIIAEEEARFLPFRCNSTARGGLTDPPVTVFRPRPARCIPTTGLGAELLMEALGKGVSWNFPGAPIRDHALVSSFSGIGSPLLYGLGHREKSLNDARKLFGRLTADVRRFIDCIISRLQYK